MFSLFRHPSFPDAQPLIIGALGGSGTRLVTNIVRMAGWYMGGHVSEKSLDSLPMRRFLNGWFIKAINCGNLSGFAHRRLVSAFSLAIEEHRKGAGENLSAWGWKNPRNMWLIPFYHGIFPGLKFIHVVRDGRDMSLSKNHFLLKQHGKELVGKSWRANPEGAQLKLWAFGNMLANETGTSLLGDNYFLLRYEDLCNSPVPTLQRLSDFLCVDSDFAAVALNEIRPSPGIGRGQLAMDIELGSEIERALARFAYS